MFYNYIRNALRLRACALHYTRDHPCLHIQYLLSRVEASAHALTCRLRKVIVYYACNPPHELRVALLTPNVLHIPP